MENSKLPQRKRLRLKEYDYSSNGAYFITICTKDKKHLLSRIKNACDGKMHVGADNIRPEYKVELSEDGKIAEQAIENIAAIYKTVKVDKYVIMPNHIHLIIFIENKGNGRMISAPTRSRVIGQMKRYASKTAGRRLWQKSFYDHIIRNYEDYTEKRNYIDTNPLKWEEDKYYK